jgi:hypothetical protein
MQQNTQLTRHTAHKTAQHITQHNTQHKRHNTTLKAEHNTQLKTAQDTRHKTHDKGDSTQDTTINNYLLFIKLFFIHLIFFYFLPLLLYHSESSF